MSSVLGPPSLGSQCIYYCYLLARSAHVLRAPILLQVGVPSERGCSSCHHRLSVTIAAVSFIPRGPGAGGAGTSFAGKRGAGAAGPQSSKGPKGGGKGAGGVVLQPGMPLPNKGACKHYRHSYRWLRFPCCGKDECVLLYCCIIISTTHSASTCSPRAYH